ncbi:MAG: transcription antitermination protein NusB [Bacilli bacterium]
MLSRSQEQEKIMFVLYQCLFYERLNNTDVDLQEMIIDTFEEEYEEVSVFAKETILKALKFQKEIDELISANLINWKLDRINLVAHAIFLLAISEHKYVEEEIDKIAVINVAVNLAKKYLDDKDYKFINAILDKVL